MRRARPWSILALRRHRARRVTWHALFRRTLNSAVHPCCWFLVLRGGDWNLRCISLPTDLGFDVFLDLCAFLLGFGLGLGNYLLGFGLGRATGLASRLLVIPGGLCLHLLFFLLLRRDGVGSGGAWCGSTRPRWRRGRRCGSPSRSAPRSSPARASHSRQQNVQAFLSERLQGRP